MRRVDLVSPDLKNCAYVLSFHKVYEVVFLIRSCLWWWLMWFVCILHAVLLCLVNGRSVNKVSFVMVGWEKQWKKGLSDNNLVTRGLVACWVSETTYFYFYWCVISSNQLRQTQLFLWNCAEFQKFIFGFFSVCFSIRKLTVVLWFPLISSNYGRVRRTFFMKRVDC